MLMLARKNRQSIKIGDDIEVFVFHKGGKVWLGVEAPREIEVHRKEVWERMKEGCDERKSA